MELTDLGDAGAAETVGPAFDSAVQLEPVDELAARLRRPLRPERSWERVCAEPLLVQPLLAGPLLEGSRLPSLVRASSSAAEVRRDTPGKVTAPSSARWKSGRALPGRDRPLGGCGNGRAGAGTAAAVLAGSGAGREGSGEMLGTRPGEWGVGGRATWTGPGHLGDSSFGVPGVGGRGSREGIMARMRGDPGCEDAELGRGIREGDSPRGVTGRLRDFKGLRRGWLGHGCGCAPSSAALEGAAVGIASGSAPPTNFSLPTGESSIGVCCCNCQGLASHSIAQHSRVGS